MYNKSTKKRPISEYVIDYDKFWKRIKKGGDNDCWDWIGAFNTTGYGLFHVQNNKDGYEKTGRSRVQLLSHRIAANLKKKVFQHDYVMHTCDNRKCCNPAHLRVGTAWDNMMDMIEKGRDNFGGVKVMPENGTLITKEMVGAGKKFLLEKIPDVTDDFVQKFFVSMLNQYIP